jgi:DNA repair protein RadC
MRKFQHETCLIPDPGGSLKPSQNDILATEAIGKALKTIESYLLDHIIIADNDYYSFKDSGLL